MSCEGGASPQGCDGLSSSSSESSSSESEGSSPVRGRKIKKAQKSKNAKPRTRPAPRRRNSNGGGTHTRPRRPDHGLDSGDKPSTFGVRAWTAKPCTPLCPFSREDARNRDYPHRAGGHTIIAEIWDLNGPAETCIAVPIPLDMVQKMKSQTLALYIAAIRDSTGRDIILGDLEGEEQYRDGVHTDASIGEYQRNRELSVRRMAQELAARRDGRAEEPEIGMSYRDRFGSKDSQTQAFSHGSASNIHQSNHPLLGSSLQGGPVHGGPAIGQPRHLQSPIERPSFNRFVSGPRVRERGPFTVQDGSYAGQDQFYVDEDGLYTDEEDNDYVTEDVLYDPYHPSGYY